MGSRHFQIQVFPQDTGAPRRKMVSVWRIAFWLFASAVAVIGFLWLDPTGMLKRITDQRIYRIYAENKQLLKTMDRVEDDKADAANRLEQTEWLRHKVVELAGIQSGEIVETNQSQVEPTPGKNLARIRKAHKTFRNLLNHLQENPEIAAALPIIHPLVRNQHITQRFEMVHDRFTGMELPHRGIDYGSFEGDTVFAPGAGVVEDVQTLRGFGITLTLRHWSEVSTLYAHLNRVLVRPGQSVRRGTPIALVGSTGRTTGTHLHYEVRLQNQPINPEDYFLTN